MVIYEFTLPDDQTDQMFLELAEIYNCVSFHYPSPLRFSAVAIVPLSFICPDCQSFFDRLSADMCG